MTGNSQENHQARHSIFSRMALYSSTVLLLSTLGFAIIISRYFSNVLTQNIGNQATITASLVASTIDQSVSNGAIDEVYEGSIEAMKVNREIEYIVVSSETFPPLIARPGGSWSNLQDGVFETTDDMFASSLSLYQKNALTEKLHVYTTIPIVYGVLPVGRLHIGYSRTQLDRTLGSMYWRIGIIALLTLFFGLACSFAFSRQLTQPIGRLRNFAQELASGNLNARADVRTGNEIEELSEAMNRMAARLAASQELKEQSIRSEAALREKEILLREIHHRVKNNMQILSSLLRMQARRMDNEEVTKVMNESESRIRSMSLIHEKLYQSESLSTVNLQDYLNTLTQELRRVYQRSNPIDILIETNNIELQLDTAMPCGLIVNELVSNAMKYAFPADQSGTITVGVSKQEEGTFTLYVADNGCGLPPELDIEKSKSLGLKLVRMLTDQIQGTLRIDRHQGCAYHITFQESRYQDRV